MDMLINQNIHFSGAGLFRSEREWIHPRRTESSYEIIYVTEGKVYLNEGGKELCLNEGQLILLEPHREHFGYKTSRGVEFYWLHFFADALPFEGRLLDRFDSTYLFRELLHYGNLPRKPEYIVNSIVVRIVAEIRFLFERNLFVSNERAEKIYEWLRVNASAAVSVQDAARHFGFSADHVSRLLKKSFGVGAKSLIDNFTLLRAKELLCSTDKYINEIAYELGFCSDNAFICFFKYHEGMYPSAYRGRYYKTHMNSK